MDSKLNIYLSKAYKEYIEVVFQTEIDLKFWNVFLEQSVSEHTEENPFNKVTVTSIFSAFDINVNLNTGYLKAYEKHKSIGNTRLQKYKESFFSWVINGGIVRIYIAAEIAFIQTIWKIHFPSFFDPIENRNNMAKLHTAIRNELKTKGKKAETKNNRHLIEYLSSVSPEYQEFLSRSVKIDLKTNWSDFFELVSILRNIFSHAGSKISKNTINELKSKSKDILERHFTILTDDYGELQLMVIQESLGNFINLINTFVLNTIKIALQEKDFSFLKMK
jgi:hypothetical protein